MTSNNRYSDSSNFSDFSSYLSCESHVLKAPHVPSQCYLCINSSIIDHASQNREISPFYSFLQHHYNIPNWIPNQKFLIILNNYFSYIIDEYSPSLDNGIQVEFNSYCKKFNPIPIESQTNDDFVHIYGCIESLNGAILGLNQALYHDNGIIVKELSKLIINNLNCIIVLIPRLDKDEFYSISNSVNEPWSIKLCLQLIELINFLEWVFRHPSEILADHWYEMRNGSISTPSDIKLSITTNFEELKSLYLIPLLINSSSVLQILLDPFYTWREYLKEWEFNMSNPIPVFNQLTDGIHTVLDALIRLVVNLHTSRINRLSPSHYLLLQQSLHLTSSILYCSYVPPAIVSHLGLLDILTTLMGWPPHCLNSFSYMMGSEEENILKLEFETQLIAWRIIDCLPKIDPQLQHYFLKYRTGIQAMDMVCWVYHVSQTFTKSSLFNSQMSDYPYLTHFPHLNSSQNLTNSRLSFLESFSPGKIPNDLDCMDSYLIDQYNERFTYVFDTIYDDRQSLSIELEAPKILENPLIYFLELDIITNTLLSFLYDFSWNQSIGYEQNQEEAHIPKDDESQMSLQISLSSNSIHSPDLNLPPAFWEDTLMTLLNVFILPKQFNYSLMTSSITDINDLTEEELIDQLEDLPKAELYHLLVKRSLALQRIGPRGVPLPILQYYILHTLTKLLSFDPTHLLTDQLREPSDLDQSEILNVRRGWIHHILNKYQFFDILLGKYFFNWGMKNQSRGGDAKSKSLDKIRQELRCKVTDFTVYLMSLPDLDHSQNLQKWIELLSTCYQCQDFEGLEYCCFGIFRVLKYNKKNIQLCLNDNQIFDSLLPLILTLYRRLDFQNPMKTTIKPSSSDELKKNQIFYQFSSFWILLSILDFLLLDHFELTAAIYQNQDFLGLIVELLDGSHKTLIEFSHRHFMNLILMLNPSVAQLNLGLDSDLLSSHDQLNDFHLNIFHSVVSSYLDFISRPLTSMDVFELHLKLLNGISEIILHYPQGSNHRKSIQLGFVDLKVFDCLFLSMEAPILFDHQDIIKLRRQQCNLIMKSLCCLLSHNPSFQQIVTQNDGYARLCMCILQLENPLHDTILDSLFKLLTGSIDDWEEDSWSPKWIENKYLIGVMMDLYSIMTPQSKMTLVHRFYQLTLMGDLNRWKLCNSPLISTLLCSSLPKDQINDFLFNLICLIEELTSFSISIPVTKLLINSLCYHERLTEHGFSVKSSVKKVQDSMDSNSDSLLLAHYHYSLLQLIYRVSTKNTPDISFFQFQPSNSFIEIHNIKKFPSNGFSFCCWVQFGQFENERSSNSGCFPRLFSIGDSQGNLFEAYFNRSILQFRNANTIENKDIVLNTKFKFITQKWYFVTVTLVRPKFRFGFGQSEVILNLDGNDVFKAPFNYPDFSIAEKKHLKFCIGARCFADKFSDSYLYNNTDSFHGQIGSIYLFNANLNISQIQYLYQLDKSNVYTATNYSDYDINEHRNSAYSSPNSPSLISNMDPFSSIKLLFCFHVRATRKNIVFNLVIYKSNTSSNDYKSEIHAELHNIDKCSRQSIQTAIYSLGGIEVLFPLILKFDHLNWNDDKYNENLSLITQQHFINQGPCSSFFTVIGSLLKTSMDNQKSMVQFDGIRVVSLLLSQISPTFLTIPTFQSIISFSSILDSNICLKEQIYSYLIFELRVWIYSDFETQLYVLNWVLTFVDSQINYCSQKFGLQFFLDKLIKCYYYQHHRSYESHKHPCLDYYRIENATQLRQLRSVILKIIKLYLQDNPSKEYLECILRHLLMAEDYQHCDELMKFLLTFLKDHPSSSLWDVFFIGKGFEYIYQLMKRFKSNEIRSTLLDIVNLRLSNTRKICSTALEFNSLQLNSWSHIHLSKILVELPLTIRLYRSLLKFAINEVQPSLPEFEATLILPTIKNINYFGMIFYLVSNSRCEFPVQQVVLSELTTFCKGSEFLCQELPKQDGFLSSLTRLVNPSRSFDSSNQYDPDSLSSLAIDLLCVICQRLFLSTKSSINGVHYLEQFTLYLWSSSFVQDRISSIPNSYDPEIFQLSSPAPNSYIATLTIIKVILKTVCQKVCDFMNEYQLGLINGANQSNEITHNWVNQMIELSKFVKVVLFNSKDLEEILFGNMDFKDMTDITSFDNYLLKLIESVNFDDVIHRSPTNPWEADGCNDELTSIFLQFLLGIDHLLNTLLYSPLFPLSSKQSLLQLFASNTTPCNILFNIFTTAMESNNSDVVSHIKPYLITALEWHHKPLSDSRISNMNINEILKTVSNAEKSSFDHGGCIFYRSCSKLVFPMLAGLHDTFSLCYNKSKNCKQSASKLTNMIDIYLFTLQSFWDFVKLNTDPRLIQPLLDQHSFVPWDRDAFIEFVCSDQWDLIHDQILLPSLKPKIEGDFNELETLISYYFHVIKKTLLNINSNQVSNSSQYARIVHQIESTIKPHFTFELNRLANLELILKSQQNRTMKRWLTKLEEITREHGTQSFEMDTNTSLKPKTHWKLDSTENYSRMRRKLTINLEFDPHLEASAKRDNLKIKVDSLKDYGPLKDPHSKVNLQKRFSLDRFLKRTSSRAERAKFQINLLSDNPPFSSNINNSSSVSTPNSLSETIESNNSNNTQSVNCLGWQINQTYQDLTQEKTEFNPNQEFNDIEWSIINNEEIETINSVGGQNEKVLKEMQCELIFLLAAIEGTLLITSKFLYFQINRQKILSNLSDPQTTLTVDWDMIKDRRWSLSKLKEIHPRRYMLCPTALELFFLDQTNFMLNFPDSLNGTREDFYSTVESLNLPHLPSGKMKSPMTMLKESNLTLKWQRREISNFDYLMQLNSLAGRTYNDLTQYFVFPWILKDYTSNEIDLEDESFYRDLSKPMGALEPKRLKQFLDRYEQFEDPSGKIKKFHYGTHYSSAASVAFYMLRIEPFTSLHLALQGGKFDHADRQFFSLETCWKSCYSGLGDVKELIPEFFYLPELFINSNQFNLGTTQNGIKVDDAILPPWAKNAAEFIRIHKMALESEYVSNNLHQWIDLIFGYKQTGIEAEKAHNIFYYLTYEGEVDLNTIEDEVELKSIQQQIYHFGQTPSQLLGTPHPSRWPIHMIFPNPQIGLDPSVSTPWDQRGYQTYLLKLPCEQLTFLSVLSFGKDSGGPGLSPSSDTRYSIFSGFGLSDIITNYSKLNIEEFNQLIITVDKFGTLGSHLLMNNLPLNSKKPTSDPQQLPFRLKLNYPNKKIFKILSPFGSNGKVNPKQFYMLPNSPLLFSSNHWDYQVKLINPCNGDIVGSLIGHKDHVSCITGDPQSPNLIVTGSRNSNVKSWYLFENQSPEDNVTYNVEKSTISNAPQLSTSPTQLSDPPSIETNLSHRRSRSGNHKPRSIDTLVSTNSFSSSNNNFNYSKISPKEYRTYYGHDDMITCLAVNIEHDILVSGSKDGTCIVHNLSTGAYLRSLKPHSSPSTTVYQAIISHLLITKEGFIIVGSMVRQSYFLHLYTINGILVESVMVDYSVNDIKLSKDHQYLFFVTDGANLEVLKIYGLKRQISLDLPLVAYSIHYDNEKEMFFLGCSDGKLLVVTLGNIAK